MTTQKKSDNPNWLPKPKDERKDWDEFIIEEDGIPAKIQAISWFSGISVNQNYECWQESGDWFLIWNDCQNPVWCPKSCFKIVDKGTALK